MLERRAPCKVNLLLNILGKRPDGFHDLETVLLPVPIWDRLELERTSTLSVQLTCTEPSLSTGSDNLVTRAASRFLDRVRPAEGVRIHLEKHIPMAAGLGGGSSDAAQTLLGLNELFGSPLSSEELSELSAALGSDVPFFLQPFPALGTGRGEKIQPLRPFPALAGRFLLLIHPGFGISTACAYQALANHPELIHGRPGCAASLIERLEAADLRAAGELFYNALEAPALAKFPILRLYQEFLKEHGATGALMSGSGSTTFAVFEIESAAQDALDKFSGLFGEPGWKRLVKL